MGAEHVRTHALTCVFSAIRPDTRPLSISRRQVYTSLSTPAPTRNPVLLGRARTHRAAPEGPGDTVVEESGAADLQGEAVPANAETQHARRSDSIPGGGPRLLGTLNVGLHSGAARPATGAGGRSTRYDHDDVPPQPGGPHRQRSQGPRILNLSTEESLCK